MTQEQTLAFRRALDEYVDWCRREGFRGDTIRSVVGDMLEDSLSRGSPRDHEPGSEVKKP